MRILITSDWHLDAITAGVAREQEILGAVAETLKAAEQQEVDAYIMTGDLTDPDTTRSHPAVAYAVRTHRSLEGLGIDDYWETGNHDVIEDGLLHHTMLALWEAGARVFDQPGHVIMASRDRLPTFKVAFLPYTPRSHSYDPVAWVERHLDSDTRLVCGHLNLEGIGPGSETTEMARGRDVFYPVDAIKKKVPGAFMENGHYHQAQVYRGVHIPGSLCRLSFGEQDNNPGFMIVELPS